MGTIANCCSNERVIKESTDLHTMVIQDNMSPSCKQALNKYFPGFMTGHEADEIIGGVLNARGFTDDNTLFTDCSCPDEINHNAPGEDITSIF
jgi:hypothetical protein